MANPSQIAILYHPDAYDIQNRPLMGRRAAGKSFLEAWFHRHAEGPIHCHTGSRQHFEEFVKQAKNCGVGGTINFLPLDRPSLLQQAGTLYFPGPDIDRQARRRYRRDPRGWSIIGVTHTICTQAVMDGMAAWLTAPVEEWDAVICTSTAVRQSTEYLLAAQADDLTRRTGASRFRRPQLPVIPLGVDTQSLAPDAGLRAAYRAKLNIGAEDVAVLFVGRLSIYGKAHPFPMYLALQQAARRTGKRLHLILAGWFASAGIEAFFRDNVAICCPDVAVHVVDGRNDDERNGAWRAGDIFLSLVDNIQETFGLTPVEAMAAGLPSVVSDWDGYRDTIREGVDGFRIPTLAPPPVLGEALSDRYGADVDTYDSYLARTSSMIAVDIDAAAQALVTLIDDPDLRQRMGAAALQRARAIFDWQVILGHYEALAQALAERRAAAAAPDPQQRRLWPARLSPFEMFANYPSRLPQRTDRVSLAQTDTEAALGLFARTIHSALDQPEQTLQLARDVLARVAGGAVALSELTGPDSGEAGLQRLAIALRLAKFGVVSIQPQDGPAAPRRGVSDAAQKDP